MLSRSVLGLNAAEEETYLAALYQSHDMRIAVRIYDRNEQPISTIYPNVVSGAVQVDTTASVTRSLTAQILDPDNRLQFESANPAEGALYADNFIGVDYGVYVKALSRWVDAPVFFGPLTRYVRNGPVVDIEAQGKETLALEPHVVIRNYTIHKRTSVANAIKKVMGQIGETKFSLNMITGTLHKPRSVVTGEQPWLACVGGSTDSQGDKKPSLMSKASGNFYLFYDGRGTLTAKRRNAKPVFKFEHTKHVTSWPGYEFDSLSFRNHGEVRGGKGKNSTRRAHGEYTLPAQHPLSPNMLARNGKGRFLSILIDADNLKTDAQCRAKARAAVEAAAIEGVSATFESLPIPTLEEGDVVLLDMGSYVLTFRLRQFTIPLTVTEAMSVGFTRRASLPKGKRSF